MDYKTKLQMLADMDMIQPGQDLMKDIVLNWPHNIIANNMDLIRPLYDVLALKAGEDYDTKREDGAFPNYNDPVTGRRTYYVYNGQSFKEAIITLDRVTRDLFNFILSRTQLPAQTSPFLTMYDEINPGGGNCDSNWYLVPDDIFESTVGDGPPKFPVCRVPQMQPRIYLAGYDNSRHLVGFCSQYNASQLYETKDGGLIWNIIPNTPSVPMNNYNYQYQWCQAYRRNDNYLDLGFGIIDGSSKSRGVATAYYTKDAATPWTFNYSAVTNANQYTHLHITRTPDSLTNTVWTWLSWTRTEIYVVESTQNFTALAAGGTPVGISGLVNPTTMATTWAEVASPNVIKSFKSGDIIVVFAGRETNTSKWKVYISFSYDNAASFTVPEAILSHTNYHYTGPSLVQLANGGFACTFSTNEGQEITTNIRTVKAIISTDDCASWKNKVTVYIFNPTYNVYPATYDWPTSKIIQLFNGEVFCFVERRVDYPWLPNNFSLVRVRMRLEV